MNILVPLDYMGCAWEVVEHAATLAEGLGAHVTLLHAVQLHGGVSSHGMLETLEADAMANLQALAHPFTQRGVATRIEVRVGSPVALILECARAHDADYIVMGTHGRSGLERWVLGSVAEQVIREASCPVVTVRSQQPVAGVTAAVESVRAEADG